MSKAEPSVDALELDDLDLTPTRMGLSKEAQMKPNYAWLSSLFKASEFIIVTACFVRLNKFFSVSSLFTDFLVGSINFQIDL